MTVTIHLIEADGSRRVVTGHEGQSLMRAATAAGVDGIAADCGGCMTCATCHVFIDPGWLDRLPAPSADEDAMLEATAMPRQPNSRLSCQISLDASLDGLVATLPETQY
jgi:2Fe-2S ferredoxin